jgi:hypothetical protein
MKRNREIKKETQLTWVTEMFRKEGKEATSTYARTGTKEKTALSNPSLESLTGRAHKYTP